MPRSTAALRLTDRARVLEVLEHAGRPITISDLAFRLRFGIPWYRMRFAIDRLVADGTVATAIELYCDRSAGGAEQRYRARGYTLATPENDRCE